VKGAACYRLLPEIEAVGANDLPGARRVVGDGGLDQAQGDLQVASGLGGVAVVVADDGDDLPDVLAGARQPGTAAGRAVGEAHQGVLLHPQVLLDIALSEGPGRQVRAAGAGAEAADGGVVQADAQRLTPGGVKET
jgi:hypothetical protein